MDWPGWQSLLRFEPWNHEVQVIIFKEIRNTTSAGLSRDTEILIYSSHGWKINTHFWMQKECQTWQSFFGFSSPLSLLFYGFKTKKHKEIYMLAPAKAPPPNLACSSSRFSLATTSFHLPLSERIFLWVQANCLHATYSQFSSASLLHIQSPVLLHCLEGSSDLHSNQGSLLQKYGLGRGQIILQLLLIHL